jgi:DNA-binding transcriptional LysR family regulator
MASLVAAYIKQHPNVNVTFLTTSSSKGKELLKHGDVDFAFLMYPDDPHLDSIPLYCEPMELVCAPTHPLAEKLVISKDDLSSYGFVCCIKGSDYNRLLENYLHQIGIYKIKRATQVEDAIMILKIVEGGGGVGFLSRSTVEDSLTQGKLVRLSLLDEILAPKIKIYLFFRHESNINRASQAFIKYILEAAPKKCPYITLANEQEISKLSSL